MGAQKTLDRVKAGDALPELAYDVTATTVVLGALASRDWRPMHHDKDFAQQRNGVRDMARFEDWLLHRSTGASRPPDYFAEDAAATSARAAAAARREVFWGKIRWFAFESESSRTRVFWSSDPNGQPGVPRAGHPEFRAALRAWSRITGSSI